MHQRYKVYHHEVLNNEPVCPALVFNYNCIWTAIVWKVAPQPKCPALKKRSYKGASEAQFWYCNHASAVQTKH